MTGKYVRTGNEKRIDCEDCNGTCIVPNTEEVGCEECGGEPVVCDVCEGDKYVEGDDGFAEDCPKCGGTGERKSACRPCRGTGKIEREGDGTPCHECMDMGSACSFCEDWECSGSPYCQNCNECGYSCSCPEDQRIEAEL
ncbi:MAG: hypothetical protein CMI52_00325 [Parcubacteria group bacterium]|mgnify:FL=1|nr:hypothetical protein [Parcubacteria group bacterium]